MSLNFCVTDVLDSYTPRSLRRTIAKRRSAMARCPALRSRSGVQRQAIPGLTLDASASCLASRQKARAHAAPSLRCSAQTTGRKIKSQIEQQKTTQSELQLHQ